MVTIKGGRSLCVEGNFLSLPPARVIGSSRPAAVNLITSIHIPQYATLSAISSQIFANWTVGGKFKFVFPSKTVALATTQCTTYEAVANA